MCKITHGECQFIETQEPCSIQAAFDEEP
jgi:hypothetical protein